MRSSPLIIALLGTMLGSGPVGAGLESLALEGRWRRLLEVARVRQHQLPLRSEEALLAAAAAYRVGDSEARRRFLAAAAEGGSLAEVARVELAALVIETEPESVAALVLPLLRRAETRQLREAAVEMAVRAVGAGLEPAQLREFEQVASSLPRSLSRRLELALALQAGGARRGRLGRLLAVSTSDLPALAAAQALAKEPELQAVERWWVAEALYRHALYDQAVLLLETLTGVRQRGVPRWEVSFVRGRCAFRRGAWEEAADWYRRAIPLAPSREGAASLEVHLARALELDGDLDAATEAARRAVRLRTTDERRIFLARLRLRRGQADFARLGLSRVRGWSSRERGELMLALDELCRGDRVAAMRRLAAIRHQRWLGPASVLAAQLSAQAKDWPGVVKRLERAAWALDSYWARAARRVMAQLPGEELDGWRESRLSELAALSGRSRRRALATLAVLETDSARLTAIRHEVATETGLEVAGPEPSFAPSLAQRLWQIGLRSEATRWDPNAMPDHDASATLWSARAFLEHGLPWRAVRAGDAAWRMAGADLSVRGYPVSLQESLHPLPGSALIRRAATAGGAPWPLVAAVVREESRWRPDAVSAVGARGLMQLMPGTARDVARRLGREPPREDDLFDQEVALALGSAELGRLLRVFDNHAAAAVAAYNAGEAQARLWLQQCGAECSEELYLLNISFTATRTYTAGVLAGACAYSELYPGVAEAGGGASDQASQTMEAALGPCH